MFTEKQEQMESATEQDALFPFLSLGIFGKDQADHNLHYQSTATLGVKGNWCLRKSPGGFPKNNAHLCEM